MFKRRDESVSKIFFKYERLPSFFFVCGNIGHMDKQCKKVYVLDNDNLEPTKEWGVDLRASSRIMQDKTTDKWDRDARGAAAVRDDLEEEAFGEL